MSLRSHVRTRGRPADADRYRRRFLGCVQRLIGRGFQQISQQDLGSMEEPAITGLLVGAMDAFLDDPAAPSWTSRFFVQDERHVSDPDRLGKRRLRVDIEVVSSSSRPRPRFQIEAKRLRQPKQASLEAYLGDDGLGSFLSCRYAKDHSWAGMMGYVQTDTADQWADNIRNAVKNRSEELSLTPKTEVLCLQSFDESLPHVYRSDHLRQQAHAIEMHHIFLHCL